jgi:hypothetical protein
MPGRDHPSLKACDQGREYLASRGCQRTLDGWRNGRRIGRVSGDEGGFFWAEVCPPAAEGPLI